MQQGFGIVGGAVTDRFGVKPMIGAGMFLRCVGFISMVIASNL